MIILAPLTAKHTQNTQTVNVNVNVFASSRSTFTDLVKDSNSNIRYKIISKD